jgi:hypothetical protein
MPDSWNPETYQHRARQWQERGEALPPGKERDACVVLTEGYAHLAFLIEQSIANEMPSDPVPIPAHPPS